MTRKIVPPADKRVDVVVDTLINEAVSNAPYCVQVKQMAERVVQRIASAQFEDPDLYRGLLLRGAAALIIERCDNPANRKAG